LRDDVAWQSRDPHEVKPMKDLPPSTPELESPTLRRNDEATDLLEEARLFRSWRNDDDNESDVEDTARVPSITSHPDGMEVVEHTVGRAVGQWVLVVRCQCGRRWFEVEAFDTASCPRCGLLVFLDVQQNHD
jgi:hypothetical protein